MLARKIYQQAIEITVEAKEIKNSSIIVDRVPDLGMKIIGEMNYMDLKCIYQADDGSGVRFDYHSYDPSGPFQNLPDINKVKIELLLGSETIESYQIEFED